MPVRPKRPRLRVEPELYRTLCRQVLERDRWRCQLCGRLADLHIHHIHPRSRLGDDAEENLITLCIHCHRDIHRRNLRIPYCNDTWAMLSLGKTTPAKAAELSGREARVKRFPRITVNPEQMGGMPCIRGLRIPVAALVGMVSEGMTETEILRAYPDLQPEDIREALRYAAEAVRERELPVAGGS